MSILNLFVVILGSLILVRAIFLLFSAEMGRKQDLIKHIYKSGTDFQIAILIPFLDARKVGALHDLLQAITNQDYPPNRIDTHIAATEETIFGLPSADDLPGNVKIWTYPTKKHAKRGEVLSWLIERLLAAGGPSKLFVFLDANDIVRPDFLRNVTTRSLDAFAMQGYVALKRPPSGPVAQMIALSNRLINRIENAGRFHMGLSCKLLNSGCVIRQEVLEMLPFRQGNDIDNQEYTAFLNLNGYRIHWAPNVVVYKEDRINFQVLLKEIAHSIFNRIRLFLQYGPALILKGLTHFDFNLFEQAWSIIKPPNMVIGFIGLLATLFFLASPFTLKTASYLALFTGIFILTQLFALAVSRCRLKDIIVSIFVTPFVYGIGLLFLPFYLLMALVENIFQVGYKPKQERIGKRFDESQPPKTVLTTPQSMVSDKPKMVFRDGDLYPSENRIPQSTDSEWVTSTAPPNFATIYEDRLQEQSEDPSSISETAKVMLPISNGKNSVNATIRIYTEFDELNLPNYFLVFEYKSLSFTTQKFHIIDQAYYELQTKLKAKGFTIVSCGSCAYFYRPTAGNEYGLAENNGFCLQGKLGKELQFETDAVTVVSEACSHYTDMEQRQAVLKTWQESLETSSVQ